MMGVRVHFGYLVAALGYVTGILLLSSTPGESAGPPSSLVQNLLHVPLFGGLAACLLLSVTGGRWSGRVPGWVYGLVGVITGGFAAFDEWHQALMPGRHASVDDFLLNGVGIGGLLLTHWLFGGQRGGA